MSVTQREKKPGTPPAGADHEEEATRKSWNPAGGDGVKVTVEFVLPHNDLEYALFNKSRGMYLALCDLEESLRLSVKHGSPFGSLSVRDSNALPYKSALLGGGNEYPVDDKLIEALDAVRVFLSESLESHGVNLNDLNN